MDVKVTVHRVVAFDVLFVWDLPVTFSQFKAKRQHFDGLKDFKVAFSSDFLMGHTLLGLHKRLSLDLRKYDPGKDFDCQVDLIKRTFGSHGVLLDCELGVIDSKGERFVFGSLADVDDDELDSDAVCPACNLVEDVVREVVH
jgi:hypothetical protein